MLRKININPIKAGSWEDRKQKYFKGLITEEELYKLPNQIPKLPKDVKEKILLMTWCSNINYEIKKEDYE